MSSGLLVADGKPFAGGYVFKLYAAVFIRAMGKQLTAIGQLDKRDRVVIDVGFIVTSIQLTNDATLLEQDTFRAESFVNYRVVAGGRHDSRIEAIPIIHRTPLNAAIQMINITSTDPIKQHLVMPLE